MTDHHPLVNPVASRARAHQSSNIRIRIRQLNVNKSMTAQEDLINNSKNFNILAVQEPYLDHPNNTRATSHWSVVYPARHRDGGPRTRSVILVHKSISTDNWTDLAIDDPNISGIRLVWYVEYPKNS